MYQERSVRLGSATVDFDELQVRHAASVRRLTPLEARMLRFLAAHRGVTVSRDRMLAEVWGYSARAATRAVDNTVSRLRRKLEPDPAAPRWLVSTRGGGYRLEQDPRLDGNLAAEADPFFGREVELRELGARVDAGRVVSVVGVGGVGKTRLALRYAASTTETWLGGVWVCELADARDEDGVTSAVSRALGVPILNEPVRHLGRVLAARGRCLVVLDNAEQVGATVARVVREWSVMAPAATLLVTSRERLELPGEVLDLSPLTPDDAAALFVGRATSARRATAFDPEVVRVLVELLDHLPLAIELAAARTNLLTPSMVVARMADRFRLLARPSGTSDRQATLRATLDWSWDLLSEDERDALCQLAVFDGGFTLATVERVVLLRSTAPSEAVRSLVARSLVRRVRPDRFGLLVTVQSYAASRTDDADRRAAESRHAAALAELDPDWVWRDELDNLVSATRRAVAAGEGRVAASSALGAWRALRTQGPLHAATSLLGSVLGCSLDPVSEVQVRTALAIAHRLAGELARSDAHRTAALALEIDDPLVRASLLAEVGISAMERGLYGPAREAYAAGLALIAGLPPSRVAGELLGNLALLDGQQARMAEARAGYEAALVAHRALGADEAEGRVLGNLGQIGLLDGRWDESRLHLERAMVLLRSVGNVGAQAAVHSTLGSLHRLAGRMDEAQVALEAAAAVHHQVGNRRGEAAAFGNLGTLAADLGRLEEARGWFDRGLRVARELDNQRVVAVCLTNLGAVELDLGDLAAAEERLVAALALHRAERHPRGEVATLVLLVDALTQRGELGSARRRVEEAEAVLSVHPYPHGLVDLRRVEAELERASGRLEQARSAIDAAEHLRVALGIGPDSKLGRQIAAALARLR
ncbi:MAG: winged helix-turn-helix domain-containing protein [Myxococcota bacterium]